MQIMVQDYHLPHSEMAPTPYNVPRQRTTQSPYGNDVLCIII